MTSDGEQRRRLVRRVSLGIGALVTVAAAVWAAVDFGGWTEPSTGARQSPQTSARIVRETLVESARLAGQLGFGSPKTVLSQVPGTVTWLPPIGSTVRRGEPLFRVDDLPVVLLYGPLPMYRPLAAGTDGADVVQLEENLRALGLTGLTIDRRYSRATATVVKGWQRDVGLPESGSIELGRVVFADGPVRIAGHAVQVGAGASGNLVSYTGTAKAVVAQVEVGDTGWASAGTTVTVTLPDGAEVDGVVRSLGAEVSPPDDGDAGGSPTATVSVTIEIADQQALANYDRAPVEVRYVIDERPDVLTVPVAALLALAEGGYGLEILDQSVTTRVIAVDVGLVADGRVEVRAAAITAGMTVAVPR